MASTITPAITPGGTSGILPGTTSDTSRRPASTNVPRMPGPSIHPPFPQNFRKHARESIHDVTVISSSKIYNKVTQVLKLLYPPPPPPSRKSVGFKLGAESGYEAAPEPGASSAAEPGPSRPLGPSNPSSSTEQNPIPPQPIIISSNTPPTTASANITTTPGSASAPPNNQEAAERPVPERTVTQGTIRQRQTTPPPKLPVVRISAKSAHASKLITVAEIVRREAVARGETRPLQYTSLAGVMLPEKQKQGGKRKRAGQEQDGTRDDQSQKKRARTDGDGGEDVDMDFEVDGAPQDSDAEEGDEQGEEEAGAEDEDFFETMYPPTSGREGSGAKPKASKVLARSLRTLKAQRALIEELETERLAKAMALRETPVLTVWLALERRWELVEAFGEAS